MTKINLIMMLLPVVFMVHEYEEIIMFRCWIDRNKENCSGFVSYVYNNSNLGFKLPRSSQSIFNNIKTFELEQDARPGDLIFFTGTYNSKNPVTHVGIYIGDGRMLI